MIEHYDVQSRCNSALLKFRRQVVLSAK